MVSGFGNPMGGGYTSGNIFGDNSNPMGGFDSMLNTGSGLVSLLGQIKGLGQDEQLTDEEKYRRNFYQQAMNGGQQQQPQGGMQQFGGQLTSLLQPQQPYNFNNYGRMY